MERKINHSLHTLLIIFISSSILILDLIPYKVHNSFISSSKNTIDTNLTVILNTVLPLDKEANVKKIVSNSVRLNGKQTNEYFSLELYRTHLHYLLDIKYASVLTNDDGTIINHRIY